MAKKGKKKGLAAVEAKRAKRAAAKEAAKAASLAFETRTPKRKFDIIGQKRAPGAVTQNKSESRTRGLELRKETIGIELERKGKVNAFVDRRFGEEDTSLSKEDKLLLRYQKERQARSSRGAAFSLNEDEGMYGEDEFAMRLAGKAPREWNDFGDGGGGGSDDDINTLTHGGKALASTLVDEDVSLTLDNVGDYMAGKDLVALGQAFEVDLSGSDDEGFGGLEKSALQSYDKFEKRQEAIRRAVVAKAAAESAGNASKSKREIFSELIAKSKLYRDEAAQLKALQDEVTGKLDAEFNGELAEVMSEMKRAPKTKSQKAAQRAVEADAYDDLLADLATDERVRASDKLKSPEELARIERDRLRALEAARVARMQAGGMDEAVVEGSLVAEGGLEDDDGVMIPALDVQLTIDDLEAMTPAQRRKYRQAQRKELKKEKERIKMGEDAYNERVAKLQAAQAARIRERQESTEEGRLSMRRKGPSSQSGQKAEEEEDVVDAHMPYTFKMPEDAAELAALLEPYCAHDQGIVLARLRRCYPKELGEEGSEAQLALFSMLLVVYAMVADTVTGDGSASAALSELNTLRGVLHSMAGELGGDAVDACVAVVTNMHDGLAAGGAGGLPGTGELLLIKLLSQLFPVSDARHCVTTPLVLYFGEVLTQIPLTTQGAVTAAVFVAAESYTFNAPASRFFPEALVFLLGMVCGAAGVASMPSTVPRSLVDVGKLVKLRSKDAKGLTSSVESIPRVAVFGSKGKALSSKKTKGWRASIARAVIQVLTQYAVLYTSYESYDVMFRPFVSPLKAIAGVVPALTEVVDPLVQHIEIVSKGMVRKRRPLTLLARKAASIAMYTPLFEEGFKPTKSYDPDSVRSERRRMQKQLKSERKAAMRELRKDNAFIEAEAVRKRKREDEIYNAKIKGIYSMLEAEQGEANALERMKDAERKRRKRMQR